MGSPMLNCFLAMASLLLLSVSITEGVADIHIHNPPSVPDSPFCKTATLPSLCNKMVNGATNWHDATANCIMATSEISKKIQAVTKTLVPAVSSLKAETRDSILSTCKEAMDTSVDDLDLAMKALNAYDKGTLNTRLSAFHTDCSEALEQFGISYLPLTKIASRYLRYMDSTLTVAQAETN